MACLCEFYYCGGPVLSYFIFDNFQQGCPYDNVYAAYTAFSCFTVSLYLWDFIIAAVWFFLIPFLIIINVEIIMTTSAPDIQRF